MSSRREKRRENKKSSNSHQPAWRAIDVSEWTLLCSILLVIVALPWIYGSAEWRSQYVLAWVGVALCVGIAIHSMISWASRTGDLTVPWLTWLFFAIGLVAFVQSMPVYSWHGTGFAPSSVSIQKWALGLSKAPQSIEQSVLAIPNSSRDGSSSDGSNSSSNVPCDLSQVPESERRLAWSIEPLHTRGAVASLFICGIFVWLGRMVFVDPRKQLLLFGTLTLIGILIACVGIQGAFSYRTENFLGLKSGGSFATFVSKNSAGGFFNICIAGCLGLLGWTLLNTQRTSKDTRYRFSDSNFLSRFRGLIEDSAADLNTAQITVGLCLVSLVAALLISLCRGAAVSALGSIIVAALISNTKKPKPR